MYFLVKLKSFSYKLKNKSLLFNFLQLAFDIETESKDSNIYLDDMVSISIGWVRVMVFNATFNNISVMSWRSVLLVEETGVPRENHRPVASH